MSRGKVISIINMKGGVGKTALSVGLSSFLSESKDKKVLLIDSDPQFNATQAFISPDDYLSSDKTIFKLFKPQTELHQAFKVPETSELITKISKNDNLDLLMGNLNLVLVNKSSDPSLLKRLKRFINKNNLREVYDYIIIDCPPTLTLYTDSALISSDFYLIPNRIDRYSNIGISSLTHAIDDLIEQEDLNLKCLGMIYTMIDPQLSGKQKEIKEELESNPDMSKIFVFQSSTSFVKDMQVGKQGPIATRYIKSNKDMNDIADELEQEIEKFSLEKDGESDGE